MSIHLSNFSRPYHGIVMGRVKGGGTIEDRGRDRIKGAVNQRGLSPTLTRQ